MTRSKAAPPGTERGRVIGCRQPYLNAELATVWRTRWVLVEGLVSGDLVRGTDLHTGDPAMFFTSQIHTVMPPGVR